MKRWLRRIGKIFLGLCLFWTLVHVIEDWRGKRAWETWQRDQIAKGAIYDLAQLQGPPIPDADNFAKAPIVQDVFASPGRLLFPPNFKFEQPKDSSAYSRNWQTGQVMDLTPWADANHSIDLLTFLGSAAPRLKELDDATRLPNSRFDPHEDGDDPLFPGLIRIRQVARILNLRAVVRLRAGKSEEALHDVLTELRLARNLSTPGAMALNLAQLSIAGISMQAIWEGLSTHAWNDAQLATLQEELARANALTLFAQWGQGERIYTTRYWSTIATDPWWHGGQPFADKVGGVVGHLVVPRGWLYRNMLAADQHLAETWLIAVDPEAHRMYPDKVQSIAAWWDQHCSTPYTFFAKDISSIAAGAMTAQAQRFADRQVSLDEAYVVCALERYLLARKAYPDSLSALMPVYAIKLPNDALTGQPLHYKSTDSAFLLYSVGWDGKDDGGNMAMKPDDCPDKPPVRDWSKGDWPWPQAAR